MSERPFANWDSGKSKGVTDHGALDGLGDDDHSQYLNEARHDKTERHTLGTVVPQDNSKANDNAVVHKTGDETIAGIKTFSSSPIVPTPTTDYQTATKKYVDGSEKPFVGCNVYRTSKQSISGGSWVNILFDNEYWDTDSMHSTSSYSARIYAPSDGHYRLTTWFRDTLGKVAYAAFYKNNSTYLQIQTLPSVGQNASANLTMDVKLDKDDYVLVRVYASANTEISVADGYPGFSMTKIN